MKNIVINEQYSQADIKPSKMIEQYIAMLSSDVDRLLANCSLENISCPACGSNENKIAFKRFSLSYHECASCASLYISPRPSDEAIASFMKAAPSKVFWREQLSEVSQQSRKAKIIKPRLEWVLDSAAEYVSNASHWVDVNTGQERYLEAMASSAFKSKTLISPYCNTPSTGFEIINGSINQVVLKTPAQMITLFEVLDHTSHPGVVLTAVNKMLDKGGLCFITTILASGFDVKELGEHAKNIYPPDRMNVFSAKGLQTLAAAHGFECLEFSTPGILDVDIVAAAINENPSIKVSAFIKDLILSSPDVRANFQDFLQANMLSSYGRMLLRKV